ncbi:MAG TPA: LrgB family protein [Negativicutes bacterium]
MNQLIVLFSIMITISAYLLCRFLYLRYSNPLLNVVLLSAALIIAILLACKIPYQAYIPGADIMTFLLGPATVALAVPLYRNKHLLKEYSMAILFGISAGSLVSLVTAMTIAQAGGLGREVVISLAPKSVTIPFAVEIARIAGGDPSLAAAFVVATGTFGSVLGPSLLTWFKINNPVARGLALGTVSHGQGTAMALMEGEQQGSMAGVAMALAGVFTSVVASFLIPLLLS